MTNSLERAWALLGLNLFRGSRWICAALALPMTIANAQPALPGGDSAWFRPSGLLAISELPAARELSRRSISLRPGADRTKRGLHLISDGRTAVSALHVSSPYGWRRDPIFGGGRSHNGIDLPGRLGAPIHSTGEGIVSYAGWMKGYGNLVQIDHSGGFQTRYGHLSRIFVRDGERVGVGAVVGAMGSTGRSTGTHLHYEIRRSGQPVNPLAYIGRKRAAQRNGAISTRNLTL